MVLLQAMVTARQTVIEIDGSQGEGGGQILRTALTLSIITGKPVALTNIRIHRPQPGLKPQHLQAVRAAAAISNARVEHAAPGSKTLGFAPGRVKPGRYRFDIGTAGATGLVLQTVLLPLALAGTPSRVEVIGGTHVPWSPSYHYLAWHWQHYINRIGWPVTLTLERAGFYPKGGGRVKATVQPAKATRPLILLERGELKQLRGLSAVAGLDLSVAERQRRRALARLNLADHTDINVEKVAAYSPGTYLVLLAEFSKSRFCCCTLGARGKRAETVADEAVEAFEHFLASDAVVDAHLADQLILPLALAPGVSRVHIETITQHLLTNADILRQFLPVEIRIEGKTGEPGKVIIEGTSLL